MCALNLIYFLICIILIVNAQNVTNVDNSNSDIDTDFSSLFSNTNNTITQKNSTSRNSVSITNRSGNNHNNNNSNNKNEQSAQSQEIHKSIEILPTAPANSSTEIFNKTGGLGDFRPSPHFETYYEFNRFPVSPALPEAKHVSNYNNFGDFPKPELIKWPTTSEQPPWTAAKVKFPTPKIKEQQFYTAGAGGVTDKSQDEGRGTPSKFDNYNYENNKAKVVTTMEKQLGKLSSYLGSTVGNWNKYERRKPNYHQHLVQKNQFDFTAPVEVPYGTHKTHYEYGGLSEKPYGEIEHSEGNPWKKVIKFLTALIPIGLLISALTPTVISVTPVNGTQMRSRAEDSLHQQTKKIVNSLAYFHKMNSTVGCEDRILCELLVSASVSKNAEQHVQNLLNTFTEDGKAVERPEELKKVFAAVRRQNCEPITCLNIKENT